MTSRSLGLALFLVFVSPWARAQEEKAPRFGQGWSLLSSQTVGANANVLGAEVGFPGLRITFLHGVQDRFDVGGRFSVLYSYEGMVNVLQPELKGELYGRLKLVDTGHFGLAFNVGVGMFGVFAGGTTVPAITMPLGLVAGIPIGSALIANFGLEVPLFVTFGNFGGLTVPVLVGAGLEYFVDKSLILSLNTRMGPAINPTALWVGSSAVFDFELHLGVALKL